MQSFSNRVLRNSAFGLVGQFLIKVLSFIFTILIVRNLGAATFGQYASVLAFTTIFAFITDLGLSPFVVREVARLREQELGSDQIERLFRSVLRLRILLSGLALALMLATAWLTGRPLVMIGAIALSGLGLFLHSAYGTFDAVLGGFERLDVSASAKVINQLAFVLIGSLVLILGFGYYGLIAANLIGVGAMGIVAWRALRTLRVRPGGSYEAGALRLLRASLPFGIVTFALGLSYKFDTVLLNVFRGDLETGYYSSAYNLVFSAVLLSNVVNISLYPSLTRQAISAADSLPSIYARVIRYLMVLSLPIAVGAWALSDQIIPFLYGGGYEPAAQVLGIVIWVVPLMYTSEFLGYVLLVSQRENRVARAALISTTVNVGLNLLLVPRYGLMAASLMTVATEALLVTQYLWILRNSLAELEWNRILLRPLLASAVMGGVVYALRPYLPLLAGVAAGAVIYFVLLLSFRTIGREEWSFLRRLLLSPKSAAPGETA